MLRLYEGTIFLPKPVPECSLVEIVHHSTARILPGEKYHVPVHLALHQAFDNLCVHYGKATLMTVNYIQTYRSKDEPGILSYREFHGTEITRQRILSSDVYEVLPPFRIREWFDGSFLLFDLEELFVRDEARKYKLYSERNECIEKQGSVYKVYPDRNHRLEYVVFGEDFIYRFESRTTSGYPFRFRIWTTPDAVHLTAKPTGEALQIECPGVVESDTSKGTLSIPLEQFVSAGGFVSIGTHRIGLLSSLMGLRRPGTGDVPE